MSWTSGEVVNTSARLQRLSQSIPSSYTIWKDSSGSTTLYRAESNIAGNADINGTSATTVIQNAVDNLSAGRTWLEKITIKGNIPLDLHADGALRIGIEVPSYTIIDVQGKLKLPDSANSVAGISNFMIRVPDDQHDVHLLGGELDGTRATQTAGHEIYGIEAGSAYNVWVKNWYIHDMKETMIAFEGTSHRCWATNNVTIDGNEDGLGNQYTAYDIYYIGNYSDVGVNGATADIFVEGGQRIHVLDNICMGETGDIPPNGIAITRGTTTAPIDVEIRGNSVSRCNYGINLGDYVTHLSIDGNHVFENELDGIVGTGDNIRLINVTNNHVYNNDNASANHSGILIAGWQRGLVQGNICYDDQLVPTQDYGIGIIGASDYNTVKNNLCYGNQLGSYSIVGANNTYDSRIQSEQVQINGATTIPLMTFVEPVYIARAKLQYSTAIANDTNVTVGFARSGATDADYYVTSVTSGTGNQWATQALTLAANLVTAGDTITFTQDGSGGAGEYIRLIIDYLTGA